MNTRETRSALTRASVILLLMAAPALGGEVLTVNLDTSLLLIAPGEYSLYFQLTDGSGANDGNNTATLGDFVFGGGVAISPAQVFGGASGDLTGLVTLTDNSFFNAMTQGLVPGSLLTFSLNLTTNPDPGGTPDVFAMSILDPNGNEIPTLDPSGANTLLMITIDSVLGVQSFSSDPNTATSTGQFIDMNAATISSTSSAAPEPASLLLVLGAGLVAACRTVRRYSRNDLIR
jgi:hypothetical protein